MESDLLVPPPMDVADQPSVVLALRPTCEPWYLLEHAVDWAQRLGARLDLCSVVHPSSSAGTARHTVLDAVDRPRESRTVRRWLERLMDAVPDPVRGGVQVLEGDPGPALVEHACSYDLLLVGRRTESGLLSMLRPDVPGQVARHCRSPVMVVGGRRPRPAIVTMLPMTTNPTGLDAIDWVAKNLPTTEIVAVRAARGLQGGLDFPRTIEYRIPDAPKGRTVIFKGLVLTAFAAGRALADYARRVDPDVVALPAVRESGLLGWAVGSLVDGLLRDCPTTVLVVPSLDGNRARREPDIRGALELLPG